MTRTIRSLVWGSIKIKLHLRTVIKVVASFPKIWILAPKQASLLTLNLAGPDSSSTQTIWVDYTPVISKAYQQWRVFSTRRSYRDCKEGLRLRIKTSFETNYFKIVKSPRVPNSSLKGKRESVQIAWLYRISLIKRQKTSLKSKWAPKTKSLAKLFHHLIQVQQNLIISLQFSYPSCHPQTSKLTRP